MTIIPLLRINDSFLLGQPESLNCSSSILFSSQVSSPASLDTSCHIVPVFVSHRFESEEGFRVLDESFRYSHLPFFSFDSGIFEDLSTTCLRVSLPDVISCVGSSGR